MLNLGNTYHIHIDQYTISPLTKTRLNTKFEFDRLTTNVMMEIINGLKNPPPRSRRQHYNHVYGDKHTAHIIYYDYIDFNLMRWCKDLKAKEEAQKEKV